MAQRQVAMAQWRNRILTEFV